MLEKLFYALLKGILIFISWLFILWAFDKIVHFIVPFVVAHPFYTFFGVVALWFGLIWEFSEL
jgi:hypothetical protein